MSEIAKSDRDSTGRFKSGNVGGPGRKPGSRNKLGEAFLEDLLDAWNEHGATALERCATEEPAQFVRVVASLMPKDINLNVALDPGEFVERFRSAQAMLGNAEPPGLRRPLRTIAPRTIEHESDDAG
jgi:hypothetical protein